MADKKNSSLSALISRYNAVPAFKAGTVILIIYGVLLAVLLLLHVPTLDEAQAWLIARDASYKDILLYLPHYESHPPFWHLLLSIPAKLGVSYELGLKSIQFISSVLMISVFVFRSPFSNVVKTFVPFTYFFFYQYGLLARPYAFMVAGIFLCAHYIGKRKEAPGKLILSLAFTCMWSAYGIAVAGGIALAWVIGIIAGAVKERRNPMGALFGDRRRIAGLLALLVFAAALICEIMPAPDNYIAVSTGKGMMSFGADYLKLLVILPSEAFFTNLVQNGTQGETGMMTMMITGVISVLIYCVCLYFCKAGKVVRYMIIPYLFFNVIATRYISVHHYGLAGMMIIFSLWVAFDSEETVKVRESLSSFVKYLSVIMVTAMSAIGIYWSVMACLNENIYPVASGRVLAETVRELRAANSDLTINAAWYIAKDSDGQIVKIYYGEGTNTFVPAAPYFKHNMVNNLLPDKPYCVTVNATPFQSEELLNSIRSKPAPDVILAYSEQGLRDYLDYTGNGSEYRQIAAIPSGVCYKDRDIAFVGTYVYERVR